MRFDTEKANCAVSIAHDYQLTCNVIQNTVATITFLKGFAVSESKMENDIATLRIVMSNRPLEVVASFANISRVVQFQFSMEMSMDKRQLASFIEVENGVIDAIISNKQSGWFSISPLSFGNITVTFHRGMSCQ